jgi:predicted acetyltransferase
MHLADPHPRYHRSFLAMLDEFAAVGEEHHIRLPSWAAEGDVPEVDFTRESIEDPDGFAAMVAFHRRQRDPDAPRPRAYVAATELWMVEGDEVVGRISVRHELNEVLAAWGGHIGYAVRPSARRRGHATAALAAAVERCRETGVERVLVTCDLDNVASRRTIEGAGGRYEDTRDGKLRFWIDLG